MTDIAFALTGDTHLHDPNVIRVGDRYYAFSTGFAGGPGNGSITIRKSGARGATDWTYFGTVWDSAPEWITTQLGETPPSFWAPDITFHDGTFFLYYAASVWGQSTAAMGLVTATDIEGPWTDQGMVTDLNYPIDPEVVWSAEGVEYLAWGSWNGIYLHVVEPATGKLSTSDNTLWRLATAIESASILRNDGYYYLFGSKGKCCSGVDSTYYTVVGRSTDVTGPYLDKAGADMLDGGGTTVLTGSGPQVAAGGGDWYDDGGDTLFAYHFYDAHNAGRETLNIRPLSFEDGWPVLGAPLH